MARVLVVDDDQGVRAAITVVLQSGGFEVVAVQDGAAGRKVLETAPFDAAIVDFMMPGIGGLETVRTLRGKSALPIMVISGSLTRAGAEAPDLARLASELPGVTNLAKPFKLSDFLSTVRAMLERGSVPDAKPAA